MYTFSDSFVSLSRTSVISLSNFSRSSEAAILAEIRGRILCLKMSPF